MWFKKILQPETKLLGVTFGRPYHPFRGCEMMHMIYYWKTGNTVMLSYGNAKITVELPSKIRKLSDNSIMRYCQMFLPNKDRSNIRV